MNQYEYTNRKRLKLLMLRVSHKDGHWLLMSRIEKGGHCKASYKGNTEQAHRLSWILNVGPIPKGKLVLHKCRRADCISPDHLYIGTYQDNSNDSVRDETQARGENNGWSKLKNKDVIKIKSEINKGRTNVSISSEFGVGVGAISSIRTGGTWSHVKDERPIGGRK